MNKQHSALRKRLQDLICEEILSQDEESFSIHNIIGILEDLKIGLITSMHEAGKQLTEKQMEKNPSVLDTAMEKHKKHFEDLLNRAEKRRAQTDDGTTSTSA